MSGLEAKRPQFFEGQYLGADDLDALVIYQREQTARHVLGAHTWGIAMGLQLKEVESTSGGGEVDVYIQPGYAWDGFGRPVVVLAPYRLPSEKFKSASGGAVKVWLRYAQKETGAPPMGFETCETAKQYARVQETFDIDVGSFSRSDQHDKLLIAGNTVDGLVALQHLDNSDPLCCDESIPFQSLPDEADNPRWLIPLGYVIWEPGASGQAGRFKETTDPAVIKRSRSERVYVGVVAEAVHAADGVIRLRNRGTPAPAGGSFSAACENQALSIPDDRDLAVDGDGKLSIEELVWVEGNLRALGDVRMFGTKLDFRKNSGDAGPLWIQRVEDNTPGPGGKDLQVVIGDKADGENRFAVGPAGESEGDPLRTRFAVLDNGNVGIGVEQPSKFLHIKGSEDPTILVETDGSGGPSGRLSFRQSDGNGADIYYDDTSNIKGLVIDTVSGGTRDTRLIVKQQDGHVGIGTTSPDHDLQIGDASTSVSLSLRGSDGSNKSSALAFENSNGTTSQWFKIIHDSDAKTLRVTSDSKDPILTCEGSPGRVGIGTASPRQTLDVRGEIVLGSTGELFAVGGVPNLRVVVGTVVIDGMKFGGEGFTMKSHVADSGSYEVDFSDDFSETPFIVVSPVGNENIVTSVQSADQSGFTVKTQSAKSASPADSSFSFIAFGKRSAGGSTL